jgi:hypothetical protein
MKNQNQTPSPSQTSSSSVNDSEKQPMNNEWLCCNCEKEVDALYTLEGYLGYWCLPCGMYTVKQLKLIRERAHAERLRQRAQDTNTGDVRNIGLAPR